MKVLKFGGTSVGSVDSILSLKKIVEDAAASQPLIVVVSALGGITDRLIATAKLALAGDGTYNSEIDAMAKRHYDMIGEIIEDPDAKKALIDRIGALFHQLRSIYYGVYLIHDLSEKTYDTIVSYGERFSSDIVSTLISGAVLTDSRTLIMTERRGGKNLLDSALTSSLVKEHFATLPPITVMPGFISRDKNTGDTTNLGRGGSDYTAAIVAATLDAEVLEIWTDVDGFMTADPRVIPNAYTISELSYTEATELCNFGAKVVYPPTIYPVCVKNIPILIKNTFNPSAPGTIIKQSAVSDSKPIRGISSINDTALINVTGLSMVGVIGVNRRIFSALAQEGISVFLVSQASSENSTSIGVKQSDAMRAAEVLNAEFAKEIATGAMYPMSVHSGLATVAIVGQNMRHTPGVAGKLFGALGRSGISMIACSQGAAETNISFVIEAKWLRKALNVIHDSFFLSEYTVLNLFICGVGAVGNNLIEQIKAQSAILKAERKLCLNVVGIANSSRAIFNADGLDLDSYRQSLAEAAPCDSEEMIDTVVKMNLFNSVMVDCTASPKIARTYLTLLQHNISVVAANKIAASSEYDNYMCLKHTALTRGVKFRFETNVGAGLPIIGTINDLVASGDKILHIEAVLSGTLNFIFNELSETVPFSAAVKRAVEMGYAEPDPRIDLSGADVIRKLVILTREAGYRVETTDVEATPILPQDLFTGSLQEFWEKLPSLDSHFEEERRKLHAQGKVWRFVATMHNGHCKASLRQVSADTPFFNLEGSNNIVLLTTERYDQYPMLIKGYGAGASVTAAGVFANIMSIANI